jgi:uncharacterized protein involved in exopolysaccharide biosynthesis
MNSEGQEVEWESAVAATSRRGWWLLALAAIGALCAFGVSYLVTPLYRAEIVVMPQKNQNSSNALGSLTGQLGGLAALAGVAGAAGSEKYEALEVLQSRLLTRAFLEQKELLPTLFASDWDAQRRSWRGKQHTINDGVIYFDRKVRGVFEDRRTGLVTVRVTWRDAQQAAAWANEIVARTNQQMRARAVSNAERSIAYLQHEADTARAVEVRQALFRLIESDYKDAALANASSEYALAVIDPAVAPDTDHFDYPDRGLFALGGGVLGLLVGSAFVLFDLRRRASKLSAARAA